MSFNTKSLGGTPVENLEKLLTTKFEKELLTEAKNNLKFDSKIKFSNFAYVIRELVDIMLANRAPNENVMKCLWYIEPTEPTARKVCRKDRIKYIVQGGFSDDIIKHIFGIAFQSKIQKINLYFRDTLSAHVHISPNTFNCLSKEVVQKIEEFSQIFKTFWDMVQNIKEDLIKILQKDLAEIITENFLQDTFDDLDCLSTHTRVDDIYISDIEVVNITESDVEVCIDGNIRVELQYGSDGDLERGIGDIMNDCYPFKINFNIDIFDLDSYFSFEDFDIEDETSIIEFKEELKNILVNKIQIHQNNINIDTNSFYQ